MLVEHGPPRMAGAHDVRDGRRARGPRRIARRRGARRDRRDGARGARRARASGASAARRRRCSRRAPARSPRRSPIVADRLERALELDPPGVKDSASPKLKSLRSELATARRRASDRLRSLASDPDLQPHLQEDFVTERGGRPVVAVRASARSAVPGIVHDTSNSGQTLFVEPFAIVELSNRLRELEGDERDEVARILAELSRHVGGYADELGARRRGAGRRSTSRSRAARSRAAGAAARSSRRDDVELSPRAIRCSTRRRSCPSTCRSRACACSCSAAPTPAARRSR